MSKGCGFSTPLRPFEFPAGAAASPDLARAAASAAPAAAGSGRHGAPVAGAAGGSGVGTLEARGRGGEEVVKWWGGGGEVVGTWWRWTVGTTSSHVRPGVCRFRGSVRKELGGSSSHSTAPEWD